MYYINCIFSENIARNFIKNLYHDRMYLKYGNEILKSVFLENFSIGIILLRFYPSPPPLKKTWKIWTSQGFLLYLKKSSNFIWIQGI